MCKRAVLPLTRRVFYTQQTDWTLKISYYCKTLQLTRCTTTGATRELGGWLVAQK